jgi:hypothetical protein
MSSGEIQHSPDVVEGDSTPTSLPVLISCFLGAFLVACSVFVVIGHVSLEAPKSLWPFGNGAHEEGGTAPHPFAEIFSVPGVGFYKKALVGEKLNPVPGKDYSVFVWFKLRKIPAVGETYGLIGKFDAQVARKPGYALSVQGAPDGVRPQVYLSAASGVGRWYSFAAYPMNRKYWYLLAFSLSDDAFVSAYIGRHGALEEPALLGGHRIGLPALPASASDLVVGSFGASRFRGAIGPFGVLVGKDLRQRMPEYLAAMQSETNGIPSSLDEDEVQLWSTPSKDIGPLRYEIVDGVKPSRTSDQKDPAAPSAAKVWSDKKPKTAAKYSHAKPARKQGSPKRAAPPKGSKPRS